MAKKFPELFERMPATAQRRVEAQARAEYDALALDELRAAMNLTQAELAKKLHTNQAAVSKLERRKDMYLSTLSGVVHAMGGELILQASFPSGRVHLLAVPAEEKRRHQRRVRR